MKSDRLPANIAAPFFDELLARWRQPPLISDPVSQLCTTTQIQDDHYHSVCRALRVKPRFHRKQWEFVYIISALRAAGMLAGGNRGVVFGVGRERLPALFASLGCSITATDLPDNEDEGHWAHGSQHSARLEDIEFPDLCSREEFRARCTFRAINMRQLPFDLTGYDFCWSACALEHLGSLHAGLKFITDSLRCLRPGGVAVHTTEFNLGSASETFTDGPCVVYRESDLLEFQRQMQEAGHTLEMNLHPGAHPTDRLVDRDRDADIHTRLYVRHKVLATSVGILVRKAALSERFP